MSLKTMRCIQQWRWNFLRPGRYRLSEMSDDELIAAVAAGDHMALRELFERHASGVAARLRHRMPVDAVEDVVQETFIAVWRGAATYRQGGEVGAWIWGIARRQAVNWARKHNRPVPQLELPDSKDPANIAAQRLDLQQALDSLDPTGSEKRDMALLVLLEGHSIAEVARRFHIPEGTVKSRVHRIRHKLRTVLEGDES